MQDKESEVREREVAKHLNTMCSHLEGLAKMVEVEVSQKTGAETIAAVGKTSSKELHVKLVALTEKDDVEDHLCTPAYEVDKTYWTYPLTPQLSGRAFAALSSKTTTGSRQQYYNTESYHR